MYAVRTLPLIVPAAAGVSMAAGRGVAVLLAAIVLVSTLVAMRATAWWRGRPGGPAGGPGA